MTEWKTLYYGHHNKELLQFRTCIYKQHDTISNLADVDVDQIKAILLLF